MIKTNKISILLIFIILISLLTPKLWASPPIEVVTDDVFMDSNPIHFNRNLKSPNIKVEYTSAFRTSETRISGERDYTSYWNFTTYNYCANLKAGQKTTLIYLDRITPQDVLTITYSEVGFMQDKKVGAILTISNIDRQTADVFNFTQPVIQVANEIYRGLYPVNIDFADYQLEFFLVDTKEKIDLNNMYVTFGSLNNYYSQGSEKVAPISEITKAQVIKYANIERINYRGLEFYAGRSYYDWEDVLGAKTYNRNAVTLHFKKDIKVRIGNELGSMWFTFDTSPITMEVPQNPQKATDKSIVSGPDGPAGIPLEFRVSQVIHELGVNSLVKYSSFAIIDTLPKEFTPAINKVYMINSNGKKIAGNIKYDKKTNELRFELNSAGLNALQYKGETVTLVIPGNTNELFVDKITNQAATLINKHRFESNLIEVKLGYYIKTEVENGTITPDIADIKSGENKTISYAPNPGYFLNKIIVDGIEQDLDTFTSKYDFNNINENHKIKVIYSKIPLIDLIVSKEWIDDNNKYLTRPDSLNIKIFQDDKEFKNVILTPDNNWTSTIKAPESDNVGHKFKYSIQEDTSNVNLKYFYQKPFYSKTELNVSNFAVWEDVLADGAPQYKITIKKEIINDKNTAMTQDDLSKIKYNNPEFSIELKQLNRTLSKSNNSMIESYNGYSGNIYNGYLSINNDLVFNNIPAGKYEIAEKDSIYFKFVDIEKAAASSGANLSFENGKYFITISGIQLDQNNLRQDESITIKITNKINNFRPYNEEKKIHNLFSLK